MCVLQLGLIIEALERTGASTYLLKWNKYFGSLPPNA